MRYIFESREGLRMSSNIAKLGAEVYSRTYWTLVMSTVYEGKVGDFQVHKICGVQPNHRSTKFSDFLLESARYK